MLSQFSSSLIGHFFLASHSFPPSSSPSFGFSSSVWTLHDVVKLGFLTWSISTHSQDDLIEFYSVKYHLNADDSQVYYQAWISPSTPDLSPPVCRISVTCLLTWHLTWNVSKTEIVIPPNPRPTKTCFTFPSLVNGNQHFRSIDSSLSLNSCIQSFNKSCWFYFQNIFRIWLLLIISCLWPWSKP